MDDPKRWSVGSNEAVRIVLTHAAGDHENVEFHPAFTYPIFGDEEVIFGYQKLSISLSFAADTLAPKLDISYKDKFQAVGETKPDEIEEKLKPFLPTIYDQDAPRYKEEKSGAFTPPGERLCRYEVNGRAFEVWSALLTDPKAKQMLRQIQVLIPMFIEGGTCIELDDPDWTIERWRIFFLYAVDPPSGNGQSSSYSFAGYSTAYRLFFLDTQELSSYSLSPTVSSESDVSLPPADPSLEANLPSRQRISQFLITPPYQSSGHGSYLYSTILTTFLSSPIVREITVEDPNESFDDLRDINDLLRLRQSLPEFTTLAINAGARLPPSRRDVLPLAALLDPVAQTAIRRKARLAPRQLARLTEMQLLSTIPARHRSVTRITRKDRASDPLDRAYFFWRLIVKRRLHAFNRDMLAQLEPEERVDKLDETIAAVEREYELILERVDRRAGITAAGAANGKKRRLKGRGDGGDIEDDGANAATGIAPETNGSSVAAARARKRVRIQDDDDDDGGE